MNYSYKKVLLKSIIQSFFICIFFTFLQAVLGSNTRVLGQDFSGIKDSFITHYTSPIISESLRVIAFIYCFIFAVFFVYNIISNLHRKITFLDRFLFFFTLILGYFLYTLSSILEFPAAYENFLSDKFSLYIFKASFYLSPSYLTFFASVFMLSSILFILPLNTRLLKKFSPMLLLFIFFVASSSSQEIPSPKKIVFSKPHILMIGIDSLRTDRVQNAVLVPNISKLIDEPNSLYFQNHYVGTPRTFPSWIEMLTGEKSPTNGIRHMFPSLPEMERERVGLPSQLAEEGYETIAISDFAGDIFPRFKVGYSEVIAPDLTLDSMIKMNIDMMFPLYLPLILSELGRATFINLTQSPILSDPRFITKKAIKRFEQSDQPLFMTLFYSTAHFPYAAPWPYYSKYSDRNYSKRFLFQKNPDINGQWNKPDDDEIKKINQLYDGSLSSIDSSIGFLFENLKKSGLWDDTIIILTADHGEDLYDSGFGQGHGEHLRGQFVTHTPLIIKSFSGKKIERETIDFYTRSIDIYPTTLGLLDLKLKNERSEGLNLAPWIFDSHKKSPEIIPYSETGIWFSKNDNGFFQNYRISYPGISFLLNFDPGGTGEIILNKHFESPVIVGKHRSIIIGEYKLIYVPTPEKIIYELYNIVQDPENKNNLIDTFPEITQSMKNMILQTIENSEKNYYLSNEFLVPR